MGLLLDGSPFESVFTVVEFEAIDVIELRWNGPSSP